MSREKVSDSSVDGACYIMFDPMITNSDYEAEACHRVVWTHPSRQLMS